MSAAKTARRARKPGKVLVPVDGSTSSLNALALACERVAAGVGSEVVILNVQQSMPSSRFVSKADIAAHQEQMAAEVYAKTERITRRVPVTVSRMTALGLPAEQILQHAARGTQEIIMGTRGMGGVGNLLMGSVAMKVVQLAKVPVTLVK